MNQPPITLVHLYSHDMNIYGDLGNILTLKRRLEWRGYTLAIHNYNPGDTFPSDVDIIVGGGGQDSGQARIQNDLLTIGPQLRELADNGVPMLMICGLYQLFGRFFKTQSGEIITGIGLLDIETTAGSKRLTGNIVVDSPEFGQIVGYENHSGQTTLGPGATPLGRVTKGAGNNGYDKTEGARYKNVIGSYCHGPLLPKNPAIADFLITTALQRKNAGQTDQTIDDSYAEAARTVAARRPR